VENASTEEEVRKRKICLPHSHISIQNNTHTKNRRKKKSCQSSQCSCMARGGSSSSSRSYRFGFLLRLSSPKPTNTHNNISTPPNNHDTPRPAQHNGISMDELTVADVVPFLCLNYTGYSLHAFRFLSSFIVESRTNLSAEHTNTLTPK
jgi:hypothetical protein